MENNTAERKRANKATDMVTTRFNPPTSTPVPRVMISEVPEPRLGPEVVMVTKKGNIQVESSTVLGVAVLAP